jgi:aquaporin related protein
VAGIAAVAVADGIITGPLTVTNQLKNNTNAAQGLFLEMFLTAQLTLAVYLLAVEKHQATFLALIGIGLAVVFAHEAGLKYTGRSIDPARSFGPLAIAGFVGHHWIFWIGRFLRSLPEFSLPRPLRWLEYQTANHGQDAKTTAEPPIGPVAGSHRPSIPDTNGSSV